MKLKVISAQYRFCDTPDHKEGMKDYSEKLRNAGIYTGEVEVSEDAYPNEVWFYVVLNEISDAFALSDVLGKDLITRHDNTLLIYDDYLE